MTSFGIFDLWPLSFLFVAVVDDLVFRKFHNWIFLALTAVAVVYVYFFAQITWTDAVSGFFVGGLIMLPLVLSNAIGAGDMKFMMVFGLLLGMQPIFWVFIYALFWGALIGVLQSLFSGELKAVLWRTLGLFQRMKPTKTNKIPYTVAILFGWLSWIQIGGVF